MAAPGDQPWTDGGTIFVEAQAEHAFQLVTVVVQAALLSAGSLDAPILERLARHRTLARRYLAIEGHRALMHQERFLPPRVQTWIDHDVAGRSDSPAASLALAASRQPIEDPPAVFGTLRPRAMKAGFATGGTDVSPRLHVSRRNGQQPVEQLDEEDEEDIDRSTVDLFSSPVGGGGGVGRLLKRLFSDTRSRSGGSPGADSPSHWLRSPTRVARTVSLTTSAAFLPEMGNVPARRGATYPEWDVYRSRYRPDWCTVVETVPGAKELAPYGPPDTHALRRSLGRLGMDLDCCHRQLQGDDLDIDAAVETRVEALAGSAPDEAVYIDSARRRRGLSVLLLLDVSGSAGEPSTTGVAVHEHQQSAAASLTVALHQLGDRVAAYGFRSQGRSAVRLVSIKRFDEVLNALVMQRLGGLIPAGYTRLGAAIRHGAAVLEQAGGTSRRLLVVLSDGFAYDHGYGAEYGEADARRALAEARRRGIGCLCLSIGATTDPGVLRQVFGTAALAAISRSEELSGIVGPLFRSALRSAEQQHRTAQRKLRAKERLAIERRGA